MISHLHYLHDTKHVVSYTFINVHVPVIILQNSLFEGWLLCCRRNERHFQFTPVDSIPFPISMVPSLVVPHSNGRLWDPLYYAEIVSFQGLATSWDHDKCRTFISCQSLCLHILFRLTFGLMRIFTMHSAEYFWGGSSNTGSVSVLINLQRVTQHGTYYRTWGTSKTFFYICRSKKCGHNCSECEQSPPAVILKADFVSYLSSHMHVHISMHQTSKPKFCYTIQ